MLSNWLAMNLLMVVIGLSETLGVLIGVREVTFTSLMVRILVVLPPKLLVQLLKPEK